MKYTHLLMGFVLLISCEMRQSVDSSEDDLFNKYKSFAVQVDNSNPDQIGYEKYANEGPITITSMIIEGANIYLVDRYHKNIKKINIWTEELLASNVLNNDMQPWLQDLAFFNDMLVVLTDLDTSYMMTKGLNNIESFKTNNGKKYFIKKNGSSSIVYYNLNEKNCYSLNDKWLHSNVSDNCEMPDIWGLGNLMKPYKEKVISGDRFVYTPKGIVKLNSGVDSINVRYQARNIDYNKSVFIYFEKRDLEFVFHIYYKGS